MHIAALENNVGMVKLLLKLRADPSAYALGMCAGKTALGAALAAGSSAVATHLQSLESKMSRVPQSYSHRYQRLNRFVPIEVCPRLNLWGATAASDCHRCVRACR